MQFCFEARDETDRRCCAATPASRRDARFAVQNTGSRTPPGCDFLPCLNRGGYRFARPPGYLLASLQDVSGRLLRLASMPLFHWKQRVSPWVLPRAVILRPAGASEAGAAGAVAGAGRTGRNAVLAQRRRCLSRAWSDWLRMERGIDCHSRAINA